MAIDSTNAQRFASFSEAEFREVVLIPLLKAMGYNDVDHYHSRWELGKDIVAWKEDDDGARVYVAVVAKVGKVNASVKGDAGIVTAQVRQAFGSTYPDKTTGEDRRVHRVIVASTGSIKEPSQKAIRTQLDEHQRRHVRFWDGEKVTELVAKFLPEQLVPEILEDVRQTLQRLEYFTIAPEIRPEGVFHRIESKVAGVNIWKTKLTFPNTPQGNQAIKAIQRFIDEGGQVTIPGEYIESFEQHEELARIFGNEKPASIKLGTNVEGHPRPVRLEVDSISGPISYDGLALRLTKSGLRRSEFQTDQENEPLALTIVRYKDSDKKQISLTFKFEPIGKKVRRARQAARIWKALASGATFTLLDVKMNSPFFPKTTVPGMASPPSEFIQYVDNLAYIEDRLGWDLALPEDISKRDLLDAEELRQILECGSYVRPFETLSLTFLPKDGIDLLSEFPPDENRWLKLEGIERYELLDRTLDLGVGVTVLTVVISDIEHKRIADQIQKGADSIDITFHQAPGSEGIRTSYPRYLQGEERERFEKIHGKLDDESPLLT